ncbi:nitrous oxide-stimulated promoter family protein [Campylobacter sp. RM13119]|uniref:nitrous oxide-stimulated promoter family protein n=1 Tax=Campylobacter californiensis TaxID=1032243 RepID=UPI00147447B6|nr:nitrous oxide-stimulated promoter family protein [Campylobacter sp. RM13119]MBE3605864.1 nitrous oxide-stimulated promoter family protein [Campylobacter sp. RM13119]
MTNEKFAYEVTTVTKFIQIYCTDKHKELPKIKQEKTLTYEGVPDVVSVSYELCKDCEGMLNYSFARLCACPHVQKPRCHTCPHPCYELPMWKRMAKMMKYSGMKLGLNKIKRLFLRDKDE